MKLIVISAPSNSISSISVPLIRSAAAGHGRFSSNVNIDPVTSTTIRFVIAEEIADSSLLVLANDAIFEISLWLPYSPESSVWFIRAMIRSTSCSAYASAGIR